MNADGEGCRDLDALLERELHGRIGCLQGPCPWIGQAAYRAVAMGGKPTMPLLSSLAAASAKAAVGLATAALVVGGGSAVAAAAATHSANPATWGSTVTDAVASCKGQLGDGQHGIGQCVSAVAKKHGQDQRAAHAAGADQQPRADGTPSPHPTGQSGAHRADASTSHPSGKPSDAPAGPPASLPPASGGSHPTGPPVTPPTPSPRHE